MDKAQTIRQEQPEPRLRHRCASGYSWPKAKISVLFAEMLGFLVALFLVLTFAVLSLLFALRRAMVDAITLSLAASLALMINYLASRSVPCQLVQHRSSGDQRR